MRNAKSAVFPFGMFLMLILLAALWAMSTGSYHIPPQRILWTLLGRGTPLEQMAILDIRLPRLCIAILVGSALAASGAILQTVSRNKLADSGMIGIHAGASLFVVLFITSRVTAYHKELASLSVLSIPVLAVLGALLVALCIYFLSLRRTFSPTRLLLVGIGLNAGINALLTWLLLTSSRGDYNRVLVWLSGSLWGTGWLHVMVLAPPVFAALAISFFQCGKLDILQLGNETASSLGLEVKKDLRTLFFFSALLSALAVAFAGNLAFVGLMAGHIARRLVGARHGRLLPLSCAIGALLLILADTIARVSFSPLEVPSGLVISLLGAPYCIYLLVRNREP